MARNHEGSAAPDIYPPEVEVLSKQQMAEVNLERVIEAFADEDMPSLSKMFEYLEELEKDREVRMATQVLLTKWRSHKMKTRIDKTQFSHVGVVRRMNRVLEQRERALGVSHPHYAPRLDSDFPDAS